MILKKYWQLFSFFEIWFFVVTYLCVSDNSNCPKHIYGHGSFFYILSDQKLTANNAQRVCNFSGGSLAEVNDHMLQEKWMKTFKDKCTGILKIAQQTIIHSTFICITSRLCQHRPAALLVINAKIWQASVYLASPKISFCRTVMKN